MTAGSTESRALAGGGATRYLCQAVHVHEPLRSFVIDLVVDHNVQAVCPAFGVDLVAVSRHAVAARRRERTQEKALTVLRSAIVVAVVAAVWLTAWNFRGRDTDTTALLVACALVLLMVGLAWGALFWRVRADALSALTAIASRDLRSDFPPLAPELEDLLDRTGEANVIVYANGQGDPFVGSGTRLDVWNIGPIDIVGAETDGGDRKPPEEFAASDLHDHLLVNMPKRGFRGLKAFNRLYVRGDFVAHVPDLLPRKDAAPSTAVSDERLRCYADDPTMFARTYVCFQQTTSDDRLVVSMHVRAKLDDNLLSLESTIFVLPPVSRAFIPTSRFITDGRPGAIRDAMKAASRAVLPVLLGQPTKITPKDVFRRRAGTKHARVIRDIHRGYRHDYGAATSLREAVGYDLRQHHDRADVIDCAKRLRRRLIRTVEDFLEERGVDTSDFREQGKIINNTHINYDIGSVTATNSIVGSHGQVNNVGGRSNGGNGR